jgi:hypothetical protein
MKIERVSWRNWPEAYRCSTGPMELVVVTSMGPRILALRYGGGPNLLYEDTTRFKVGAWLLCGGHRFTTAPESDGSYLPDNRACRTSVEPNQITIVQDFEDGLLRQLQISDDLGGTAFTLRHVLRNCGPRPWHGAAWSITCVPPLGAAVVPGVKTDPRFWAPPGEDYAGASDSQWQRVDGCFVIEPRGRKGKVGLSAEPGWLAWLLSDFTLVVRGDARDSNARYPDGGSNIEVYTCADYLELETLGPLTTLLPGEELAHMEKWAVLPRPFSPLAWREIDRFPAPDHSPLDTAAATP